MSEMTLNGRLLVTAAEAATALGISRTRVYELMAAARAGEPFDEVTGLPVTRVHDVSWFEHACA